jgi:DNA-binding transcriptional LysR family regulator
VGVVVPSGAPLAGAPEVHLADLTGHELVLFPRDEAPGPHDELLAACRRHGYDPPVVHEARQPQFAVGLVLAGSAVALMPRKPDAAGVTWLPLVGEPLVMRVSCAWRRDTEGEQAVTAFTSAATAVLRAKAGMTSLPSASSRRVVPRPASGFLA